MYLLQMKTCDSAQQMIRKMLHIILHDKVKNSVNTSKIKVKDILEKTDMGRASIKKRRQLITKTTNWMAIENREEEVGDRREEFKMERWHNQLHGHNLSWKENRRWRSCFGWLHQTKDDVAKSEYIKKGKVGWMNCFTKEIDDIMHKK